MSNRTNQTLGEIIKDALKNKGISQTKVAEKMNVKRQSINQIDRRKTFDLEFLQKLKDATGLDFTQYLYPEAIAKPTVVNQELTNSKVDASIEMSLNIKVRSSPNDVSKVSELILLFRKEALRMGFTIL